MAVVTGDTTPAIEIRRREASGSGPNGLPGWLARVYAARQVTSDSGLAYGLRELAHPGNLSGLPEALDILEEAVMADARIVFVGDFDADGATSCALGVKALRALGASGVDYLVPNRFDFGYGLSPEIVGVAAAGLEPDVLVTVDNGIGSHAGVLAAQQLGITTIVTDHHLPGESLPQADAIVNPNLPGDAFSSKHLAGVGVIFYVMMALRGRLRNAGWFGQNRPEPNLAEYLDLVAIGTVADMVVLDHNNRILVSQGLSRIRNGRTCPGVLALLEVANRDPANLGSRDLAFAIAPRLNAAGRLEDMTVGIECLLTSDMDHARRLASQLDEINRKRREMQKDMVQQAEAAVSELSLDEMPGGLTLYDPTWHQGLVGLIAGRLTEMTRRPAIAFAPAGEAELKGSARSVNGIHIRDILAAIDVENTGVIQRFGGHAMAAGLSIEPGDLEQFRALFADYVERAAGEMLSGGRVVHTDGSLEEGDIDTENAKLLLAHGPWGQGFPEPLFDDTFEVLERAAVGSGFLRYKLRKPGGNKVLAAICFDPPAGETGASPRREIHAVYRLSLNDYAGKQSAQLIIEHII